MNIDSPLLSKIFLLGVIVSVTLIVCGGAWFLVQQWDQQVTWLLQQPTQIQSWWSPPAVIMCGLWMLLATQFLRVLVTSILFAINKEIILALISLLIFILLVAAFWI